MPFGKRRPSSLLDAILRLGNFDLCNPRRIGTGSQRTTYAVLSIVLPVEVYACLFDD